MNEIFTEAVLTVLTAWYEERGKINEHYIMNVTLPGNNAPNLDLLLLICVLARTFATYLHEDLRPPIYCCCRRMCS